MAKKTTTLKNLSFEDLKKIYGLQKPEHIKMRIMWNHIQALTLQAYGPGTEKKLAEMDAQFRLCERQQ